MKEVTDFFNQISKKARGFSGALLLLVIRGTAS